MDPTSWRPKAVSVWSLELCRFEDRPSSLGGWTAMMVIIDQVREYGRADMDGGTGTLLTVL